MFESELADKYPFICRYFESILSDLNKNIPNSILFYGQDIEAQYKIAKEIARILNCRGDKSENCNCLNCRWIREKTHPAVLTVTNIDSKPEDDDTKKVISIKQAKLIKSSLINVSDYFRVFIFCAADMQDDKWTPLGLNEENFKAESANALLKIVEETPQKTLFFFLTNNISDVIETIVSRSQTFFIPSYKKTLYSFSDIAEIFDCYPNYESNKVFDYSLIFQNYLAKSKNIFDKCENYLLNILKLNFNNTALRLQILNDIKKFEYAKKMYNLGMKPKTVSDNLFLSILRR